MNRYEVLPAREPNTSIVSSHDPAPEKARRGGVSAVTVVVIAAAICIALLAFVNLAYAGDTGVLQGVDTLAKVG